MKRRFLAALLVLASCAGMVAQEEPPEETLDGQLRWSFRGRGLMVASPALSPDESTIYTAAANGRIYALSTDIFDAEDDPFIWELKIPGGTRSSPMVAEDGMIYIGGNNGFLYAITNHGGHGEILWQFRTGDSIKTSPAMDEDGVIYAASFDGRLYALAPEDGGYGRAWAFEAGPRILGSPTIAPDGTIYIVAGLNLFGVSPDGTEVDRFIAMKYAATTPAVAEHGAIYFGANDDRVYAIEPGTGTNDIRWRFDTTEDVRSSPSIGVNGRVYIGSDNGLVYCFNTNGTVLWKFRTRAPVRSSAAIGADGTIYIGSDNRRLYAISPEGEERWNYRARGVVRSSPCIGSDGTVYFVADRNLYAIWDNTESDLFLDESPWPMYRRDPQHTARAQFGEPFIVQHPESVTATNGETVQFTVVARAATPITYQWLFDGEEIDPDENPTAITPTLVLQNVMPTNAGSYSVIVSTEFGEVESDPADLIINSAPVFTRNLTNHVVSVGSVLTLEVQAVGNTPMTFAWFRNGTLIEGATAPTLTITNSEPGTNTYYVLASNGLGTSRSETAEIRALQISVIRAAEIISAGNQFSAALITNALFTWGADSTGQLGDGGNTARNTPTRTSALTNWLAVSAGGVGYNQTSNNAAAHAVALLTDGSLYAWGANSHGQVGNGSTNDQRVPVRIGSETNWIQVAAGAAHTVALKANGTIWAWGANESGQLGMGTTNRVLQPTQVGVDSAWVEVRAGGSFTLARRADNTIWAWGRNESGQLGINSTSNALAPVQVGSDSDWRTIRAGAAHSLGIRTNGTLWMWGRDFGVTIGAINTSTNNTSRVPRQVGTDSSWIAISAGYNHSLAIDSANRMYAWGANNVGQLGNGRSGSTSGSTNLENVALPSQIANTRTWSDVDAGVKHSLARATDGTIWAWGWNNAGQVGDGTGDGSEARNRNVPVQITFTNTTGVTNITPTGPPVITQQPQSVQGTAGSNAVFNVTATGAPPLFYQWRFNTNAIAGATNASLTVAGSATNQGGYDVIITNSVGSVTSAVAALTFSNSAPVITVQPADRNSVVGSTTGFSVTAAGTPPLSYQWYHNFTALLTNATNSMLVITNVQMTDAGAYHVVVTNAFGNVSSRFAALTVSSVPVIGGAPAVASPLALGPVKVDKDGVQLPVSATTRSFVLEFKNNLEDPEWTPLSTNQASATPTNLLDAPLPGPSRFYRLRIQ